MAENLLRM